jgi:ABC-type Mn2+/Zn2+ transport system ATPase subunit
MPAPVIRTSGLSKRYGKVSALGDLSLEVSQGEVLGYLGPNGAGKTTTIWLLLGLITPTGGTAEIFGLDCQRCAPEAHRRLAYVPGEASLWPSPPRPSRGVSGTVPVSSLRGYAAAQTRRSGHGGSRWIPEFRGIGG